MSQAKSLSQAHSTMAEGHNSNGFLNDHNIKVREYINPAVYVETTYNMNSCNQTLYFPGSGDHPKPVTVRRCACFSDPENCPCHPRPPKEELSQAEAEGYGVPPAVEPLSMTNLEEILDEYNAEGGSESCLHKLGGSNSTYRIGNDEEFVFESDSGITVKASNSTADLRLSIPSLTSIDTVRCANNKTKSENFREWCRRKDCEKKLQEERDQLIQKIKEQQKQAVSELERENFKRWLANKKKLEEEAKKIRLQQEAEKRREEEEKTKRLRENDRSFQMWLRRKEKRSLEEKIKQHLTLMEREEEKQRRIEISQRAYEIWREHSKNRQKPIPFGRGMDSLKSSASVSYINPQPWVPNIDPIKPHSQ